MKEIKIKSSSVKTNHLLSSFIIIID